MLIVGNLYLYNLNMEAYKGEHHTYKNQTEKTNISGNVAGSKRKTDNTKSNRKS